MPAPSPCAWDLLLEQHFPAFQLTKLAEELQHTLRRGTALRLAVLGYAQHCSAFRPAAPLRKKSTDFLRETQAAPLQLTATISLRAVTHPEAQHWPEPA